MRTRRGLSVGFTAVLMASSIASVGCQVQVGGQTLPSPYYLLDDVQYYPVGPEFKLAREAAAMRAMQAEQEMQTPLGGPPGPPVGPP